MYLSRFARDVTEDWTDKSWYPPKDHKGTSWLPSPTSTDEKLNLNNVNVLLTLYSIETTLSIILMLGSCCGLCAGGSSFEKKA